MWKRKRDKIKRSREGEDDIFRSSKKTVMSPTWAGGEGKEEENLRKMMRRGF